MVHFDFEGDMFVVGAVGVVAAAYSAEAVEAAIAAASFVVAAAVVVVAATAVAAGAAAGVVVVVVNLYELAKSTAGLVIYEPPASSCRLWY